MVDKVGILFIGLVGLSVLVILGAAISKLAGWGWPEKEFDPNFFTDEQKAYMREVQMRNLVTMAPQRGYRQHQPQPGYVKQQKHISDEESQ